MACFSAAGMSIGEMREYLANREHGAAAAEAQLDLLTRQRLHLQQQAQDLRLRQQYIDRKIDYWQAVQSHDADALAREQVRIIAAAIHAPKSAVQRDRDSERPE